MYAEEKRYALYLQFSDHGMCVLNQRHFCINGTLKNDLPVLIKMAFLVHKRIETDPKSGPSSFLSKINQV